MSDSEIPNENIKQTNNLNEITFLMYKCNLAYLLFAICCCCWCCCSRFVLSIRNCNCFEWIFFRPTDLKFEFLTAATFQTRVVKRQWPFEPSMLNYAVELRSKGCITQFRHKSWVALIQVCFIFAWFTAHWILKDSIDWFDSRFSSFHIYLHSCL